MPAFSQNLFTCRCSYPHLYMIHVFLRANYVQDIWKKFGGKRLAYPMSSEIA